MSRRQTSGVSSIRSELIRSPGAWPLMLPARHSSQATPTLTVRSASGTLPRANRRVRWDIHFRRNGIWSPAVAFRFSPDGHWLATSGGDNYIRVYDLQTKTGWRALSMDSPEPQAVAFSPDGTKLAALTADGKVYVWSLREDGATRFVAFKGIPDRRRVVDVTAREQAASWLAWVTNDSIAVATGTSAINVIGLDAAGWQRRFDVMAVAATVDSRSKSSTTIEPISRHFEPGRPFTRDVLTAGFAVGMFSSEGVDLRLRVRDAGDRCRLSALGAGSTPAQRSKGRRPGVARAGRVAHQDPARVRSSDTDAVAANVHDLGSKPLARSGFRLDSRSPISRQARHIFLMAPAS